MVRGRTPNKVPEEYIYFVLSDRFGWTPLEIDEIDEYMIGVYLEIITLESREIKREQLKNKR